MDEFMPFNFSILHFSIRIAFTASKLSNMDLNITKWEFQRVWQNGFSDVCSMCCKFDFLKYFTSFLHEQISSVKFSVLLNADSNTCENKCDEQFNLCVCSSALQIFDPLSVTKTILSKLNTPNLSKISRSFKFMFSPFKIHAFDA